MGKNRGMKYRRLPGKKSGFFSRCTLYRGEDHFLSVESNIYNEEYFRFYFADIQAFISRRTSRGRVWSVVLGFLALVLTTCTINAGAPPAGPETFLYGILAAVVIVFLVYNLWLGTTCETWVQTAVTVHALPTLGRSRRREKFLAAIRPLIRNVQGQVDPNRLQEIQVAEVYNPQVSADVPPEPPLPDHIPDVMPASSPTASNAGLAHGTMFAAFLFGAGFDALWVISPSFAVLVISMVISFIMLVSAVTALVVQSQSVPSIGIRKLTWTAMIGFLVVAMSGYILTIFYMIGNIATAPANPVNPWSFLSAILQNGVMDMPVLAGFILFSAAFFCVVGVLGLAAMLRERRSGTVPRPAGVITGKRSDKGA